jgi:hypothetical protein
MAAVGPLWKQRTVLQRAPPWQMLCVRIENRRLSGRVMTKREIRASDGCMALGLSLRAAKLAAVSSGAASPHALSCLIPQHADFLASHDSCNLERRAEACPPDRITATAFRSSPPPSYDHRSDRARARLVR